MHGHKYEEQRPRFTSRSWTADGYAIIGQSNTIGDGSPNSNYSRESVDHTMSNRKRSPPPEFNSNSSYEKRVRPYESPKNGSDKYASPKSPSSHRSPPRKNSSFAISSGRDFQTAHGRPDGRKESIDRSPLHRSSAAKKLDTEYTEGNGPSENSPPETGSNQKTFPSPLSVDTNVAPYVGVRTTGSGGSTPQCIPPVAQMTRSTGSQVCSGTPESPEGCLERWKGLSTALTAAAVAQSLKDAAERELFQRQRDAERVSKKHSGFPALVETAEENKAKAQKNFADKEEVWSRALSELQNTFAQTFKPLLVHSSNTVYAPTNEKRAIEQRRDSDFGSLQEDNRKLRDDNKVLHHKMQDLEAQMKRVLSDVASLKNQDEMSDNHVVMKEMQDLKSNYGQIKTIPGLKTEMLRLGQEVNRLNAEQGKLSREFDDQDDQVRRNLKDLVQRADANREQVRKLENSHFKLKKNFWDSIDEGKPQAEGFGKLKAEMAQQQRMLQDLTGDTVPDLRRSLDKVTKDSETSRLATDGITKSFADHKEELTKVLSKVVEEMTLETNKKLCSLEERQDGTTKDIDSLAASHDKTSEEIHKRLSPLEERQDKTTEDIKSLKTSEIMQNMKGIKTTQANMIQDLQANNNNLSLLKSDLEARLKRIEDGITAHLEKVTKTTNEINTRVSVVHTVVEALESRLKDNTWTGYASNKKLGGIEDRLKIVESRPATILGSEITSDAIANEVRAIRKDLAELGVSVMALEQLVPDMSNMLDEENARVNEELQNARKQTESAVDDAIGKMNQKFSEIEKVLAMLRRSQPQSQPQSPNLSNAVAVQHQRSGPQSPFIPPGYVLPSQNGQNGIQQTPNGSFRVPSPQQSNGEGMSMNLALTRFNGIEQNINQIRTRLSQFDHISLQQLPHYMELVHVQIGALQDLETRFSNLTTDDLSKRMVHTIQSMYPAAPNFLATLQVVDQRVGAMEHAVRQFKDNIKFHENTALALTQFQQAGNLVDRCTIRLDNLDRELQSLKGCTASEKENTEDMSILKMKVDVLDDELKVEKSDRRKVENELANSIKTAVQINDQLRAKVDSHGKDLSTCSDRLKGQMRAIAQIQNLVADVNGKLPTPLCLPQWKTELGETNYRQYDLLR